MMNICGLIQTKIMLLEEESDDDVDEEYDCERKADDYLNEVIQDEVFENNDKNENYTFNTTKMKYKSKIPGKRIPKHYIIKTYDKFKDKLKRDRRELNLELKILKCFYPDEFTEDNYEKGKEDYELA
jgi:hypothetical protein